jgi:hypothetical protein
VGGILQNTSMYFAFQASFQLFKFAPGEFSLWLLSLLL